MMAQSSTPVRIDVAERTKRQEAVDFARHSIGLEGLHLNAEAEALFARYVRGELDWRQFKAAALKVATEHGTAH
ncbi:antitoxin VbhA family protein [Sulfobacillus sp. hq2]|uniref:antitoxin VbhA family protein n=1 Tax=Sulfobacillus sp. hq2 TaxID=2039167 RepID=UPI000CD1B2FF|nr:antitoxin VbhA family protein [Sulfobacillus sp. hq2]